MKKIITLDDVLNDKHFRMKFKEIIINGDKPISITKKDYEIVEGMPKYSDSEKIGRSGTAIAIISTNTLAVYTSEDIEYPYPINWSDIIHSAKVDENTKLYNKSHIIGYNLSAKNADYNNIMIGTYYMNHTTMRNVEDLLYKRVTESKRAYLYKVTPIYKELEDTVPFGVLMEAETIDVLEKDQFCRFCYNIQKGVKINYYNGSDNPSIKILETWKLKKKNNRNNENNKFKDYYIDVRTKTFHLQSKNCSKLQNIDPKYIQETRAFIDDVINKQEKKGYKMCKKCISLK